MSGTESSRRKVVVVGASGFGRECLDVLDAMVADGAPLEVVGVVEATRYDDLLDDPALMYYLPFTQAPTRGTMRGLLVRMLHAPFGLALRRIVARRPGTR